MDPGQAVSSGFRVRPKKLENDEKDEIQFKWVKCPQIGSIALKASTHKLYWLINLKRSKFKSKQGKWAVAGEQALCFFILES